MPKDTLRIFDGATALVTGGSAGIGRALAQELARGGSELVLADLRLELAEEVASKIRGGRKALDAITKNKAVIVIVARCKLSWWIQRLCPSVGPLLAKKTLPGDVEEPGLKRVEDRQTASMKLPGSTAGLSAEL